MGKRALARERLEVVRVTLDGGTLHARVSNETAMAESFGLEMRAHVSALARMRTLVASPLKRRGLVDHA
jgi:hypothetical protein